MTHPFSKKDILYFINTRKRLKKLARMGMAICEDNLCGACGFSAYITFSYLKEEGYDPTFVHGESHCWVEAKGYIIDLTATQFGDKPILIINKQDGYSLSLREYNYREKVIDEFKDLDQVQDAMAHWDDQEPTIVAQEPYRQVWQKESLIK